jgi:ketosteroid isomerase-like protein
MTRPWCTAGAATALVLAVSGCGGVDRGPATDTAQRFYAAVQERDGEAACALLAPSTRSELEQSAGMPCPQAVLEEEIPEEGDPTATEVFGTMAQVRYADETAFLTRSDQGWLVLAVACGDRPEGQERPYDCQVKGG